MCLLRLHFQTEYVEVCMQAESVKHRLMNNSLDSTTQELNCKSLLLRSIITSLHLGTTGSGMGL